MTATQDKPATLTKQQGRVLKFIERHWMQLGYAPTIREISTEFGFASPVGAMCHLQALRKKGRVTWADGVSRTIRPTRAAT